MGNTAYQPSQPINKMNPISSLIANKDQSEQMIRSSMEKNKATCHTKARFVSSFRDIPISPVVAVNEDIQAPLTERKSTKSKTDITNTLTADKKNSMVMNFRSRTLVKIPIIRQPSIQELNEYEKKARFYIAKSFQSLPKVSEDAESEPKEKPKPFKLKKVTKPTNMYDKYHGRGEAPNHIERAARRSQSMKRLEDAEQKEAKEQVKQNFLEEIRELALTTVIDKDLEEQSTKYLKTISSDEDEEQQANETSIEKHRRTSKKSFTARPQTGKNFVIKSSGSKGDIKETIYPSSISHIPTYKKSERKSYKLKKPSNIFCSVKSKRELFNEIMEDRNNHNKVIVGSIQTITSASTAATEKKSIFEDDSRYYKNDKSKKCIRAINNDIFGDKTRNVGGFGGNLSARDPGHKKVRFVED